MKIIIAGGRDFNNYDLLARTCNDNLPFYEELIILSGCARGADTLGEKYATELDIPVKHFPANWDKYNKAAGYIRNKEMAEYGDKLIAFWDGKSKGTKHMIDLARANNLSVTIVKY